MQTCFCFALSAEYKVFSSNHNLAVNIVHMEDRRLPKKLMCSQLAGGQRNVGYTWLRYKDNLKTNLTALKIDNKDFELNAYDRDDWKSNCHQRIKQFSAACIEKLKETRIRTKVNANLPATLSLNPHTCGLVCKSLAGLKCQLRLSKCRWKQQ